jgi:mannose-6-phosphate isomerase-like protein (cupin superfamily)
MINNKRAPIVLRPGEGRKYQMGAIRSIFKSDGEETLGRYSISEWWIDAGHSGPGKHTHDEDDAFFVIEGTMSFFVDDKWFDAEAGTFVLAPAGIEHDFENRSSQPSGVLNISIPGNFESNMGPIVDWFKSHPPKKLE